MLLWAIGFSLISFCISLNGLSHVIVGFDVKCNFWKATSSQLLYFGSCGYNTRCSFTCLVWQMVFNVVYLMDFKILDKCIGFCHGFSMSMCIWMLLMHWKRFHGFWNLVWSFGLLSSIKPYFGSLEDSSGSVRRKRVPQVRAREDNRDGYRGSPGLVKMVLTRVLTRVLAQELYC